MYVIYIHNNYVCNSSFISIYTIPKITTFYEDSCGIIFYAQRYLHNNQKIFNNNLFDF